jgi:hypothetical protein
MRTRTTTIFVAVVLAAIVAMLGSGQLAMGHAGGRNPDHLSLVISPPKSGTITSTPFSLNHVDDCGATHGVDYCHHHALYGADWSFDEGASAGNTVTFNVHPGFANLYVVGYVQSITANCSAAEPRGYNVVMEVWVWDYARSVWRQLGLHNLAHVTPWVSAGSWVGAGQTVGTVESHSWYTNCWEGVHVHGDYLNYEHYAAWTDKAWIGASVSASATQWWLNDSFGVFGGTYGSGPDGHGGTWTGY